MLIGSRCPVPWVGRQVFAETWSGLLEATLARTAFLRAALDAVGLEQDWAATSTSIGRELRQVPRASCPLKLSVEVTPLVR